MFGLKLPELILIAVVALVFFGKDKLPDLAKDLGKSINTFKDEVTKVQDAVTVDEEVVVAKKAPAVKKAKVIKKVTKAKK